MSKRLPVVAVVGRTNVGKSTLFNRIAKRHIAIVEDTPGVTRDRSYACIHRYDRPFTLIDTGGLVGEEDQSFSDAVRAQTEAAMAEADLIVAVFDGLAGVHPLDFEVSNSLRRSSKPVLAVVNKCEKPHVEEAATEFYALGFEQILCVSAAHNLGVRELLSAMLGELERIFGAHESGAVDEGSAVRVAVVGKPNVGKSTFINRLLGQERLITSDTAGTTRDSVDITLTREGQLFTIVDTAGLRKKAKVRSETIERYASLHAFRSLVACDVAVLLIDAELGPPTDQDAKIAGLAHDHGVGLVIVVNKWDLVEKDHKSAKEFKEEVYRRFKFARYAPVLFVSALTGKRCPNVLKKVQLVHENCQVRIQTSRLNDLLERAFLKKPPPVFRGQPVKLFFATQTSVAPPTIVLFVNHKDKINFSYQRYLKNAIRKYYQPFEGTDIKLVIRKRTPKEDRRLQPKAENGG